MRVSSRFGDDSNAVEINIESSSSSLSIEIRQNQEERKNEQHEKSLNVNVAVPRSSAKFRLSIDGSQNSQRSRKSLDAQNQQLRISSEKEEEKK